MTLSSHEGLVMDLPKHCTSRVRDEGHVLQEQQDGT